MLQRISFVTWISLALSPKLMQNWTLPSDSLGCYSFRYVFLEIMPDNCQTNTFRSKEPLLHTSQLDPLFHPQISLMTGTGESWIFISARSQNYASETGPKSFTQHWKRIGKTTKLPMPPRFPPSRRTFTFRAAQKSITNTVTVHCSPALSIFQCTILKSLPA